MVEACRSMPQHLILWLVGGGFEACRSTLKIWLRPKYESHLLAVIQQRWLVLSC